MKYNNHLYFGCKYEGKYSNNISVMLLLLKCHTGCFIISTKILFTKSHVVKVYRTPLHVLRKREKKIASGK